MEELLEELVEECRHYTAQGRLADYIPELTKGNISDLGIYVTRSDGKHYQTGGTTSAPGWGWRPQASPLTPSMSPTKPCSAST